MTLYAKCTYQNLDLVFAIDCTVSMELYIQDATNKAREIIRMIDSRREIDVRFALIEYRDHPPQVSVNVHVK
jgi:hypothetical protein